jgi:hypothetical protein
MAIDINRLKQNLSIVAGQVQADTPAILLLTGKRLEGLMKKRIFNQGLDAKKTKIGKYKSKSWIKKRDEKGNQTSYVDLQFKGDLIRSFKTVRDGDEVVLAIVNNQDAVKAFGNEERRKKVIFEPTIQEFEQAEEYFEDLVSESVIRAFNSI